MNQTLQNVTFVSNTNVYGVKSGDNILNVDSSFGPITIVLPNIINSGLDYQSKVISINDVGGMAGVNPITIIASSNTVNGGQSSGINVNFGTAQAIPSGQSQWIVNLSTDNSKGSISGSGASPQIAVWSGTTNIVGLSALTGNTYGLGVGTNASLSNRVSVQVNQAAGYYRIYNSAASGTAGSYAHAGYIMTNDVGNSAGFTINSSTGYAVSNNVLLQDSATILQSQGGPLSLYANNGTIGEILFSTDANGYENWRIDQYGNLTNIQNDGSAQIHLRAVTPLAGTSPIKLTNGTNLLTTTETGVFEYSNNVLYFTPNTSRYQFAYLDGGQTFTSATWNGSVITTQYGGTGLSSYTANGIIYASATNTLSQLPTGTTGQMLVSQGAGAPPQWVSVTTGGTVTAFSFTNSNGFTGVVTNPSTTPNLTLSTSVSGVIKGSSGALVAATNSDITGFGLTGFVSGPGTVTSADTILTAFEKINGNVALLSGALIYKGMWNASTNTPTLTSGTGTSGYVYIVSVAGSTNLDGITEWNVGDWAVFNGTVWQRLAGTPTNVVSVFGRVGVVTAQGSDYSGIAMTGVASYNGMVVTANTGVITTATWNGTAVGPTYGGTGQTTYTTGDILYSSATNTLSKLAIGSTGQVLTVSGGVPTWAAVTAGTVTSVSVNTNQGVSGTVTNPTTTPAITLSLGALTGVTSVNGLVITSNTGVITTGTWNGGVIAAGYGGTGLSSFTQYGMFYAPTISTFGQLPLGTSGQILVSQGAGAAPQWTTLTTGGTVTSVSVTTNQGVSGAVTNPTTTPAITLSLGALTGVTSINGLVITANNGVITTGTWNGTAIANAYLANSSITINGNTVSLGGSTTITANTPNNLSVDNSTLQFATGTTWNGSAANTISVKNLGITNAQIANSAIDLTAKVTNALPIANGGTNITTYTTGDILYASATNVLSKLGIGSTGQVLGISAGVPSWVSASGSSWSLIGNSGTTAGTNFLGTTDGTDVVIKANSVEIGRFLSGAGFRVTGASSVSTNYSFQVKNSSGSVGFAVTDGKNVALNGAYNNSSTLLTFNGLGNSSSTFAFVANNTSSANTALLDDTGTLGLIGGLNIGSSAMTGLSSNTNSGVINIYAGSNSVIAQTVCNSVSGGKGYFGSAGSAYSNAFGTSNSTYILDLNGKDINIRGTANINLGTASSATGVLNVSTTNSRVGINIAAGSATAQLHLSAGTAVAGTAPLKFNSGTNLTSVEAGAMEYDGTNLYFSPSSSRYNVAYINGGQTFTSAIWNGTAIGPTYGGTGQTTYTTGDMLYASGTNALSKLAIGSTGQVLTVSGGVPTWAAASGGGWSLTGNSGTTAGTNFIGTTDAKDVVFKANSIEVARAVSGGGFQITGFGSTTGTVTLKVQNSSSTATLTINDGGYSGFGIVPTNDTKVQIQGNTSGSSYASLRVYNSSAFETFNCMDNGGVGMLGVHAPGAGYLTIGAPQTLSGLNINVATNGLSRAINGGGGEYGWVTSGYGNYGNLAPGASGATYLDNTAGGTTMISSRGGNVILGSLTGTTNWISLATSTGVVTMSGQFKYTYGSPVSGNVLTSDGSGNASWSSTPNPNLTAIGLLGSTIKAMPIGMTPPMVNTGVTASSGYAYMVGVYLPTASTLTGVKYNCFQPASGSSTTNYCGVALYSYSAGTLTLQAYSTTGTSWIANSGNQSFTFSGLNNYNSSAAPAGIYYIVFYMAGSMGSGPFKFASATNYDTGLSVLDYTNNSFAEARLNTFSGATPPTTITSATSGYAATTNGIWATLY